MQTIDECEMLNLKTGKKSFNKMLFKRVNFAVLTGSDNRVYVFAGADISIKPQQQQQKTSRKLGENFTEEESSIIESSFSIIDDRKKLSTSQNCLKSCERLRDDNSWEKIADLNVPRYGLNCFIGENGAFYVCGGFDNNSSALHSIEKFDPFLGKWTFMNFMNKPRAFFGLIKLPCNNNTNKGCSVLVFGGVGNNNHFNNNSKTNSSEVFFEREKKWKEVENELDSFYSSISPHIFVF